MCTTFSLRPGGVLTLTCFNQHLLVHVLKDALHISTESLVVDLDLLKYLR
jgi:hypothetical protein